MRWGRKKAHGTVARARSNEKAPTRNTLVWSDFRSKMAWVRYAGLHPGATKRIGTAARSKEIVMLYAPAMRVYCGNSSKKLRKLREEGAKKSCIAQSEVFPCRDGLEKCLNKEIQWIPFHFIPHRSVPIHSIFFIWFRSFDFMSSPFISFYSFGVLSFIIHCSLHSVSFDFISLVHACVLSFIPSFFRSFIHWLSHQLLDSLVHWWVHWFIDWVHSLNHSSMQSFIWCFNERFNQFLGSPIHTFTLHSFLHWFTQWFLESSIHWVIHSLIHSPIHVMSFHFPSLRFFSTYVMCHFIFMWFFIVRFISLQVRNGFMWLCIHSFILVMSIISLNFIHFISLHSTPFRSIPSHAFISCHVISSFSLFRSNVMSFQFS